MAGMEAGTVGSQEYQSKNQASRHPGKSFQDVTITVFVDSSRDVKLLISEETLFV